MNDQMPPVSDQPRKNNTPMIIAAVVVVVLCCCCILGAVLYQYGDQIFGTGSVLQSII